METVTVRMARGDRQTSWGFGVTEAPNGEVFIVNVVGGSLADRAGLRNGDLIDSLEGLGNLDINAVDRLLVTSRDKIEIVVHRSSGGGGQARIWRPEITDNRAQNGSMFTGAPPPVEDRPYRVSLEHNSDTRPPQGFNQAPMPFNADPRVKHLQYNSPMGLYSNDNVAESYQQQTQGFVEGAAGVQGGRTSHDQPAYLRSETLRLLKEQEGRGGSTLSSHPNPNGLPTCFVCTRPILGVMARAAGKDIHGDCLSCATCGNSLRNVGHHFIDDKFYCDIHGRQKKCMTPVGLDPNAAVRSTPTAAQPVRPTENIRAFYQPEVLQRKASPSPAPGQTIVSTHYGNPKTQGPISPSNRGVPTGSTYADGAASARQSVGRALSPAMRQMAPPTQPAPPVPANPPPSEPPQSLSSPPAIKTNLESRIPSAMRAAVSPRRPAKTSRQWPPPPSTKTGGTTRYWQIDPAGQGRGAKKNEPHSLQEMIESEKKEEPKGAETKARKKAPRGDPRRQSIIQIERPAINHGIHWTVITGPKSPVPEPGGGTQEHVSPDRSPPKEKQEDTEQKEQFEETTAHAQQSYIVARPPAIRIAEQENDIPNQEPRSIPVVEVTSYVQQPVAPLIHSPQVVSHHNRAPTVDFTPIVAPPPPTASLLNVVPSSTTDQSTSPIPMITLERRKSCDRPRLPCTSSPVPFVATPTTIPAVRQSSPPTIRVETRSPIETSAQLAGRSGNMIGINTAPRPFLSPRQPEMTAKPLKKVDFSRVEQIPSPKWETEVVDESDIVTEGSGRRSDEDDGEGERGQLRPYDGDESELRSNTTMDELDEQEEWMREELEQARKEELAEKRLVERESKEEEEREWDEYKEAMRERQREERQRLTMIENEWTEGCRDAEENGQVAQKEHEHSAAVGYYREPTARDLANAEWRQMVECANQQSDWRQSDLIVPQNGAKSDDGQGSATEEWHPIVAPMEESMSTANGEKMGGDVEVDDWRQKAMELMLDESQTERDLAIVAALHQRLQGLRELEEDDRARAIECIERHQKHLEDQQDQLGSLLDCAIQYLKNLDEQGNTVVESSAVEEVTPRAPTPPVRGKPMVRTESLSEVLDELRDIRLPSASVPTPTTTYAPTLSDKLARFAEDDQQSANSFTRSTFERTERKDDYSNRGGAGSGTTGGANTLNQAMSNLSVGGAGSNVRAGAGAGGARVAEGRGQGSLTNPGGRIPFCEACKQQIRGAFVLATGLAWCPEHFVCANSRCGRRLLECGFVEENGQKYCEGCFEAHIAPRCEKCAKPIVSDCLNALQKKWHPTCFTCSHCQKPFGNSAFYLENQLPYCEADWNKLFTTKCVSCQYAIEAGDRWVEALGSAFHSNCFNCTRCRTNLEGESFFAKNGQPFCKLHA